MPGHCLSAVLPLVAVGVYETGFGLVRRAVLPRRSVLMIALRLVASHCSHSRGLCGGSSGVQEQSPQSGQRPCCAYRSRRLVLPIGGGGVFAPPFGPVLGQGGVIRGCSALDHLVSDDLRPGELEQVGAAFAVAEHPPVLPGLVEHAEVPVHDPALRLVRVAMLGPLVGELPQVIVQRCERLAGHRCPVVGRPAPDDGVEPLRSPLARWPRAGTASRCAAVPGSV